jgi:hypothetical protein
LTGKAVSVASGGTGIGEPVSLKLAAHGVDVIGAAAVLAQTVLLDLFLVPGVPSALPS